MSLLAPLLLGVSVAMLTTALWPKGTRELQVEYRFVEEEHVPRTLH
jgi:hypothetical protein